MDRINLIENGYFPKELPPCFTTKVFAKELDAIMLFVDTKSDGHLGQLIININQRTDLTQDQKEEEKSRIKADFKNKMTYSACTLYNIPKIGLSRREVKIPNPLQQGKLALAIEKHFPELQNIYSRSQLSITVPIENKTAEQSKRAVTYSSFGNFREKCILSSYHMQIQLSTDISKFYHSIYTHAVPWAIDGKQTYKKNRALSEKDPTKKKNLFGDRVDECLMNCQSQQTKGIPIGPDTSLIVAEIIGCHMDYLLQNTLKKKKVDFVGFRYIDDYFLYFHNQMDAEIALDALGNILADFELELNHEKTHVQVTPFTIESEWTISLKSFFFRPEIEEQKDDIWNYFALAFQLAKKYSEDSVLAFALNKFFYVRVEQENWDIFESLLLKTGLAETSTLQMIARILVTYKSFVTKRKVKNFAYELIRQHAQKNHDYEITWALFLLKQFEIIVSKNILETVFQTNSVTAILIGLEILQKKKYVLDMQNVLEKISSENLTTQYWLLIYEIVTKGWLGVSAQLLDENFFFSALKSKSISFYDANSNLEPIKVQRSILPKILVKLNQVEKSLKEIKVKDNQLKAYTETLAELKSVKKQNVSREEFQNRLSKSEQAISELLKKLSSIQQQQDNFDARHAYFVLEYKLGELQELTKKELAMLNKEGDDLLFNPAYV
jgi:hypothetical protein